MNLYIIVVIFLAVFGVKAQENVMFLPLGEPIAADSVVIHQLAGVSMIQHKKYVAFWSPQNTTQGSLVLYHRSQETGDFIEVNRIIGSRLWAMAMATNNEWIVTFDGATRRVKFFQLDENHQMINAINWPYQLLTTFAYRIRLLPNNNFITHDMPGGKSAVVMYPYIDNNWPTTVSATIPSDTRPFLGDTSVMTYNSVESLVTIYAITGNNFTFVENISLPFNVEDSYPAYTYNEADVIVFAVNNKFIDILEKNNNGEWVHKTAAWNCTDDQLAVSYHWVGSDLYISALMHGGTRGLMGQVFKFERSDAGTWNNTMRYQPSPVFNATGFSTYGTWAFTATESAVFAVASTYKYGNSTAAMQLQYYPHCYKDEIPLICEDKSYLSCDTVNMTIADLYSIDDQCGSVVLTNHNSSLIEVSYDDNNEFSTTIEVRRFEQVANCTVTIQCGVEPVAQQPEGGSVPAFNVPTSNVPLTGSPSGNTPSDISPKGNSPTSAGDRTAFECLLASLLTIICFVI